MKKLIAIACALAAMAATPGAYAAAQMKPVIAGFIDMQDINWHNTDQSQPVFTLDYVNQFPGLFSGIVLNATWNEMQPNSPAQFVTARIDNALAQVRAYNALHPDAPLGVKLRIFSGNQAPTWAEEIAGGPVKILRNPLGCKNLPPICPIWIGKVWDPRYIAAWRAFQMRVAQRYDSNPLIRSVAITSCTMETDEPFVMPTAVPKIPKGYTDTAQRACLAGAIVDYAAWRHTAIDYTFNTFVPLEGTRQPDLAFTLSVMNACRARLHAQCELGNHAFASNMRPGNVPVVDAIAERGAPIHFQTEGPTVAGFNWAATMRAARTDNATALELWPQFGGFTTLKFAEMKRLHALFEGQ